MFHFQTNLGFAAGKFMTDGVWWFPFLTPAYLSSVYDLPSTTLRHNGSFLCFMPYLAIVIGGCLLILWRKEWSRIQD